MNFFSFLGTSAAVPTEERDNVSILFNFGGKIFLVDVGGSPVQKLNILGCDWMDLSGLILTHTHPDHIYGLPSLVHCLGLKNSSEPLYIYAYPQVIDMVKSLLEILFGRDMERLKVLLKPIPQDKISTFYSDDELKITAISANHRIEALSLVFETSHVSSNSNNSKNKVYCQTNSNEYKSTIVYSSDTRPNYEILNYAKCAEIVIHEATFLSKDIERARKHGHSTAIEAAEFANSIAAKTLFPCHFDLHSGNTIDEYLKEIKETFKGKVIIPDELIKYHFSKIVQYKKVEF